MIVPTLLGGISSPKKYPKQLGVFSLLIWGSKVMLALEVQGKTIKKIGNFTKSTIFWKEVWMIPSLLHYYSGNMRKVLVGHERAVK